MSAIYLTPQYKFAICYPKKSNAEQVADIAAKYISNNPEERAKNVGMLVWQSHYLAFGLMTDSDCWLNDAE